MDYHLVTVLTINVHMATIQENGERIEATCAQERRAISDTIDVIGGKWSIRILRHLNAYTDERHTFKKMMQMIGNISSKVLSQELHALEMNQLICRTPLDTRPIMIEYTITEYGKSVLPIAESLAQWGLDHRERLR